MVKKVISFSDVLSIYNISLYFATTKTFEEKKFALKKNPSEKESYCFVSISVRFNTKKKYLPKNPKIHFYTK